MTDDLFEQPQFGARLLADRKARGMSRQKYAEMTGLTSAKISNLEKGRKPRPEELMSLAHLAFGAAAPTETPPEAPVEEAPAVEPEAVPAPELEPTQPDPCEALLDLYIRVYGRLDGRSVPATIPYLPQWGAPGSDPQFFDATADWCRRVDTWLDEIDGTPQVELEVEYDGSGTELSEVAEGEHTGEAVATERIEVTELGEGIGPEDIPPPEVLLDEDEAVIAEEEELAIVTDAEWAFPDDGIRRVSNGELRCFKRCRRRWWLAYYRRLGLPLHAVTGAAPLGTRVHRCLSVYYVPAGQTPGDPFAELERTIQEDLAVVGGDEFKVADLAKEKDLAHAMLEGYFEWLAETAADQGIEVVAPETKLEVDARLPDQEVHLIAKLDVRAVRTFGSDVARLFIDHKTVGDLTSPTKMLQFDEQMLHYDLCEYLDYLQAGMSNEEAIAVRTDGALYNMLRKAKRTQQANPPFYGRVEVRHNVETLRSYWMRVAGTINEIQALETKLNAGHDHRQVAYPTPTKDCSWDCDFYHVCTMFDDGSRAEDMLTATYVEVDPLKRYMPDNEGHTL